MIDEQRYLLYESVCTDKIIPTVSTSYAPTSDSTQCCWSIFVRYRLPSRPQSDSNSFISFITICVGALCGAVAIVPQVLVKDIQCNIWQRRLESLTAP